MRLKSAALVVMPVACAANFGDQSRSSACNSSLVLLPVRFQNTPATRSSVSPARSIASIVLAKVVGLGSAAIALISALWDFSAISNAGAKCSGFMSRNGGASNGVVQVASSGLGKDVMQGSVRDREWSI